MYVDQTPVCQKFIESPSLPSSLPPCLFPFSILLSSSNHPSVPPFPRKPQADLAQHTRQAEQLHHQVADLQQQVRQLSTAVEEGNAGRKEAEHQLERSEKERNHWQQKSLQQDMVLQTTRQVHCMRMYMYMCIYILLIYMNL